MGNTILLFALVNFILCLGVVALCLCRLNAMSPRVLYRVRSEYSIYLTCALASAFQPMWGEWPGWGALAIAASLLWGLLVSAPAWRHGVPHSCTNGGEA